MTGLDQLTNWDIGYFLEPFFAVLGPVFPAAIAVGVLGATYVYTRSVALPTVLAMLLGGGMIIYLPAEAQTAGQLLIIGGIALAIWVAYTGGRGGGRL